MKALRILLFVVAVIIVAAVLGLAAACLFLLLSMI